MMGTYACQALHLAATRVIHPSRANIPSLPTCLPTNPQVIEFMEEVPFGAIVAD